MQSDLRSVQSWQLCKRYSYGRFGEALVPPPPSHHQLFSEDGAESLCVRVCLSVYLL